MVKRIFEAVRSDFEKMSARELLESVTLAEGKAILAEVAAESAILSNVSSVELAAAFGADLVALNAFDVLNPRFLGLPQNLLLGKGPRVLAQVAALGGVPIGINLEPIDEAIAINEKIKLPQGRIATVENGRRASEMGASFICLTGNPKTGVTNQMIIRAVAELKLELGEGVILMAGKMHSAGVTQEMRDHIISERDISELAKAGCDVLMVPAPGTVQSVSEETARKWIQFAHDDGLLAMTCLDSAIEGSDLETIKRIALHSKMAGADIQHIGDAGFNLFPDNIMTYCMTVKGRVHTFRRMAWSTLR